MKNARLLFWLLLGLALLAVPISMILKKEAALSQGTTVLLRLAPVDPYDPFRGRFMRLNFEIETLANPLSDALNKQDAQAPLYARIKLDAAGFGQVTGVQLEEPSSGLYLRVKRGWRDDRIQVPFNRYYMNEDKAPRIEAEARSLIAEAQKEGRPNPVYAVVNVHKGEGVLLELRGPKGPLTGE